MSVTQLLNAQEYIDCLESAVMAEKVENRRGYGEEVIGVWKNGYSVGETGN